MDGEHRSPPSSADRAQLGPSSHRFGLVAHLASEAGRRAPCLHPRAGAELRCGVMGTWGGNPARQERPEGSGFPTRERSRVLALAPQVAGARRQAGLAFGHCARVAAAAPGQMFCSSSLFSSQRLLLPSAWPPGPARHGRQIPLPPSPTGPRTIRVGGETPQSPPKPTRASRVLMGWGGGSRIAFGRSGRGGRSKRQGWGRHAGGSQGVGDNQGYL